MTRSLPSDSLETLLQKIVVIPKLLSTCAAEFLWVRKNRPDVPPRSDSKSVDPPCVFPTNATCEHFVCGG